MMTKRDIAHLVTAFRFSAPLAKNYGPDLMREMREATKQWSACVIRVADMMETAQEHVKPEARKFNRAQFLNRCGIENPTPTPTGV